MKKILIILALIVTAGIVTVSLFFDAETTQESSRVINISASEFHQKKEREPGIVIDVRTLEEFEQGHLAVTDRHYDLLNGDFEAHLDSLDKNETYYLYCRSGSRSGRAAKLMAKNDFRNVYNIGGFQDLVDAGLETKNVE